MNETGTNEGRMEEREPWGATPILQSPPRGFERRAIEMIMRAMGSPAVAIVLWDDRPTWEPDRPPVGTIRFADRRALWRFLVDPSHGVADGYVDGHVSFDGELIGLLAEAYRASKDAPLGKILWRPKLWRGRNGLARARANASHHYDLDHAFFAKWLDPRLVYTCAYFAESGMTLEQAQRAKLDYVCKKLDLRRGQRLVDAGSGWGALAIHAAQHYGVTVRAFNVSLEQTAYAQQRARELGLEGRIEFVSDDYRNMVGTCDAFASVGMLEHVGFQDYPSLRRVIDRCLAPDGRGLLHFIGRTRPTPMDRWIEREMFPGAYFPSLREMLEVLEPSDMAVLDVENLRLHYARTVELWLANFDRAADDIARMYDDRFVRRWRLYLAASAAAFRAGTCQLFQVTFARSENDAIPWTRAHLYRTETRAHSRVADAYS
jgi:cyclopropane-fatty-acyl-phospholipid synthase